MAEEVQTSEPDLTALRADLDASLNSSRDKSSMIMPDSLPAKPEAINIYRDNIGNPVTGSNPKVGSSSAEAFAQASLKATTAQADNPYTNMRPFTYSGDYDGANFDRYYGTKAYKTLGFSPYRDNDALYNQKMTYGDQFVRAASQFDNMVFGAIAGGVRTWGTMFTDPLAPDLEGARDMARSNAIGGMTQGGFGAFVGNTMLNSAYSIGIGLEFLAEEAALAAATAFSGGLAGEVTLPAMVARGGFLGRQLLKAAELGAKVGGKADKFGDAARMFEKAGQFGKVAKKTAGGDDINSARDFFNKAANGAFDMVNPLESTATALKSTRYANDLAKTVGTAGAFMDDIIRIKTAASEAKLEGGFVKIDATEKLIDQYRQMHGKDPEGEDLQKIEDLSSIEARRTTLYNFPAIMTTNKLLFSTILYPLKKVTGTASTRLLNDIVAEGGMKALVENPFKVIGKTAGAQLKAVGKSFANPKAYGSYGMTYLKANLAEGLQENIQEAISQGAINHALAVQKDPTMAAYRGYMGYLMDGMKDQVSAQGAETFASGFVMGAFTQPIMSAPAWAMAKGIDKFKSKESREAAKAKRDAALLKEATTLNEMANNDINYWAPDIVTAVKNGKLSKDMVDSASIGDVKSAKDAKFRLEFNHIATAANSGKFDDLMTKLADYKNLTPAEALEAFKRYNIGINTEEDAVKALGQIDGVIERAKSIKANYEKVAQDFPNPYNLSGIKADPIEMLALTSAHRAWAEAQQNLVFANSEFENYSTRIASMTDAFSSLASGIAKGDAQSLLSVTSIQGLADEVSTLNQEIKNLNTVEGQAAVRKQKEKTRDLLQSFGDAVVNAQNKIKTENITDYSEKQLVYQEAKKEFQKYLTHLAKKNNTILFNTKADEAFNLLTDTLEMSDEQHRLAKSINVLNNPKGFLTLQKRLQEAFAEHHTEKEQIISDNLKDFITKIDENTIIQGFGKMGVKIPEDFLAEYKESLDAGKFLPDPTYFIDPSTQSKITAESDPAKFAEALELWKGYKAWMELNHSIKSKEEAEAIVAVNLEKDKQALEAYNDYDQSLRDDLTAMYNKAKADGIIKDGVSLATFLHTNPEAILQINVHQFQARKDKAEAEAAAAKDQGIPLGIKVNPEARNKLNLLGYTNTQIDKLSREEREFILTEPVTAEDYYKTAPVEEVTKKEPAKGYTQKMPGGRSVVFNKELRTWEFYTKNGKRITDKKAVAKLVKELSAMPNIIPIWWEHFLTDSERADVKDAFDELVNKLMQGAQVAATESLAPTPEKLMMQALQGVKFKSKSDVDENVSDLGMAWLRGSGYKSADAFVDSALRSEYQQYGMELPDDTTDLINDVYDMINAYPKGILDKDIKEYNERINPNQDITDLQEAFADTYGLDIEKAHLQLKAKGLLDKVTAPLEEKPITKTEVKRQPITNPSALKEGDVLVDAENKEYVFIAHYPATAGEYSPDDNVTFPGEPESIATKDRTGKFVNFYENEIGTLSMKPYAKRETVIPEEKPKEPVTFSTDAINPAYEGKVIFITPGSGKTKLAKNNKDIIDADQLLLETISEIKPDFPISDQISAGQNIYEAIRHGGVNRAELYNKTRAKIKEITDRGQTVLTSSVEFMKNSDFLLIQTNEDFILDKYDRMKELNELNNLSNPNTIAINQDISEAIKKTPAELLGSMETIDTEEPTVTEPTIEDINQNLTVNNLQIAQEKGYDAIHENNRYAITKVEQNSVTLKSMDDTAIIVKPEEISAVTKAEDVVTTAEENKDFKDNQKVLDTGTFDIDDDADDLDAAADDIRKNIC